MILFAELLSDHVRFITMIDLEPTPGHSLAHSYFWNLNRLLARKESWIIGEIMSLEKFRQKTYYELLGVPRNATGHEIERAFSDLARIYDPASDFFSDIIDDPPKPRDVEIFKLVTLAYNTLRDPEQRKVYDSDLPQKSGAEVHLESENRSNRHGGSYPIWAALILSILLLILTLLRH